MAYAVKYLVTFSNLFLRISKKDFTGDVVNVDAGRPAVIHKWDEDDPIPPIKGSSITVNIIGVPLLDFYANNDDEFKGELFKEDNTPLFSGYLVQDDCTEDVDDLTHLVTLSFTDNLGLLKDVAFDGETFTPSKISLFSVIKYCITQTGIELPLIVFSHLKEESQNTGSSFLEQTLIAKESFLKSEREYDNCYSVLESILKTFGATLMQANGQWIIIRFLERPATGFAYNSDFSLSGITNNYGAVEFGLNKELYPEYPYHKSIVRPYKSVKETFDYKLPYQILKNSDLKELGTLITTYTINEEDYKPNEDPDTTNDYVVTVKEYGFPKWFDSDLSTTTSTYFIRVFSDPFGNELERYVVVKNDGVMSTAIEGTEGDQITFSFNLRTNISVSLPATLTFVIRITNGTKTQFADDTTGGWKNTVGFQKQFTYTLKEWNSVEIKTGRLPFDGLVTVFIRPHTQNPADETHFNDLRFVYTSYINESTKITGQTHTHPQDINTKNKSDEDIVVDDSPRNFISGTLFLNSLTGNIQTRSSSWNVGNGIQKLGDIVTGELKQWRSRPRTVTEGTLYGKVFVSPINTFSNPAFPELHFVPGKMEIDYANENCTGTMHELYETIEAPVISEYKFEYIYDTK